MLNKQDIAIIVNHLATVQTTVARALKEISPVVNKLLSISGALERDFVVEILSPAELALISEFRGKANDPAQPSAG